MRILGFDLESTGRDPLEARILEVGVVLWDTDTAAVKWMYSSYLWDVTYPDIPEEITELTGITQEDAMEFGADPKQELLKLVELFKDSDAHTLCAHNGNLYDKELLKAEAERNNVDITPLLNTPWIDTRTDLPSAKQFDSYKLKYLATDHHVCQNQPGHRALFDVLTMLSVLKAYPIEDVLKLSQSPSIVVRACVNYDQRQWAKDEKFMWEQVGTQKFPKMWVKQIKVCQLEAEQTRCPFPIAVL